MFGTRYEILRHVLREAEAHTNRNRGSRLQRVVPLKITNVASLPLFEYVCHVRAKQHVRTEPRNENHKFRNLRFYRGWQLRIKIGWKTVYPAIFSPSLIISTLCMGIEFSKLREHPLNRFWIFNEENIAFDLVW